MNSKPLKQAIDRISLCEDIEQLTSTYQRSINLLSECQSFVHSAEDPNTQIKLQKEVDCLYTELRASYFNQVKALNVSLRGARRRLLQDSQPKLHNKDTLKHNIHNGLLRTKERVQEEIERTSENISILDQTGSLLGTVVNVHHHIKSLMQMSRNTLRRMKREELISNIMFYFGLIIFLLVILKIILVRIFRV
ncbi:hypothetical protein GEMRC1_004531 [Eukaryota sp. GEM-RC1]